MNKKKRNVLIIGDTHAPFTRKGYMNFCARTRDKYKCDTIVHIGDEVDNHSISDWNHDPDGLSSGHEFDAAYREMKKWQKLFPEMYLCIGNHTARPQRFANKYGLSMRYLRSFNEMWEAPDTWKWSFDWEFDGVLYTHGTGTGGLYPHANLAKKTRQSVVMGHIHTVAGIHWMVCKKDKIFGMCVGSGMDDKTYAAAYARTNPNKSAISCGVVLDNGNTPLVIMMNI